MEWTTVKLLIQSSKVHLFISHPEEIRDARLIYIFLLNLSDSRLTTWLTDHQLINETVWRFTLVQAAERPCSCSLLDVTSSGRSRKERNQTMECNKWQSRHMIAADVLCETKVNTDSF